MLERYLPDVGVMLKKSIGRERSMFDALKVQLAEQLYLREHGKPPENLKALIGPHLKSLPDGYAAEDESSLHEHE